MALRKALVSIFSAQCFEKWSEYHTYRVCEDEVNCKGHTTELQEAVHVENVKNDF